MTALELNEIIRHYHNLNMNIKDIKLMHDHDKNLKIISFSYKKMDDMKEGTISMPYNKLLTLLCKEVSYE